MAKKRKKLVRRTLKSSAARGRIPRDKNGKFVNKSGSNRSKGANVQNLRKGRKAGAKNRPKSGSRPGTSKPSKKPPIVGQPKKGSTKKRPSKKRRAARAAATVGAGVAAYAVTNKLMNDSIKRYRKREDAYAESKANGMAAAKNYVRMAERGHSVQGNQWYRPTEERFKSSSGRSTVIRPNLGRTRQLAGTRTRR